jgi:lysyl endopeptidase
LRKSASTTSHLANQKLLVWFVLLSLLGNSFCKAQLVYSGPRQNPNSTAKAGIDYLKLEDAAVLQTRNIDRKKEESQFLKPSEFAYVLPLNIELAEGEIWDTTLSGIVFSRRGFTSPNASSLGITFDPFILNPGSSIILYSPDRTKVLGAYTFRNMNKSGLLAISQLPGDSLIVEIQTLLSPKEYGHVRIASVSIGYPGDGIEKTSNDGYYGWSADCNVDINCINDPHVQMQKHSVCRLVIEKATSRVRCSGTLLNNTSENGLPYVLTAGHCISDMYSANRTIFYFDYESPYCNGPDGEIKSISGSDLISRGDNLDFALLALYERPPIDYNPLYSGWDATGNAVDTSYCIHHPEGDVKKYAGNVNPVQTGDFNFYDSFTHWLIPKYEEGTTENGSSGAPLFNSSDRLVGSLTGGGVECTEYIYDFYQKFENCWNDYLDPLKQLKIWLDPENTGLRVLNNLDPYMGAAEQLSNITGDDSLINPPYHGWGYISGHNSAGTSQYAEHFYRNGTKYIYGAKINVAKAYTQRADSRITLKIWDGTDRPEIVLFVKSFYSFELVAEEENFLRLDTLIQVDRNFFMGYEINYETPLDTFAVFTALHTDTEISNSAYAEYNGTWQPLTNGVEVFNASLAISPLVIDYYPPPDSQFGEYPFGNITLYPNPTYDKLQILFKNRVEGEILISVYDLMGNLVTQRSVVSPEPNFAFDTGILSQGIFLLKIEYPGNEFVSKIIKLY